MINPHISEMSQRGGTLVELMVAIAIGLIVTLAVTTAYIGGKQTQTAQSDLVRLQEAGRFAIQLISNEIARSGFHNAFENETLSAKHLGDRSLLRVQGTDGNPFVTGAAGGDTLTARYYGEANWGATASATDDSTFDCQGNSLERLVLTEDTLKLDLDAGGEPWLACEVRHINAAGVATTRCPSGAGTDCRLVPGIEALQFLYGVDSDHDGVVNYYANAGSLTTTAAYQNLVSVRAAIVVRSITFGDSATSIQAGELAGLGAQTFDLFGSDYNNTADTGRNYTATADGRIRRLFVSEVFLRNPDVNSSGG